MTTVPCPRCAKPVGVEEEICPHCRTPRDDMEMEEGRALVRKEELRLERQPKLIKAGVFAAVFFITAWCLRGYVTGPAGRAWDEFQTEVEKTRQPEHWVPAKSSETAPVLTTHAAFMAPATYVPAPAAPVAAPVAVPPPFIPPNPFSEAAAEPPPQPAPVVPVPTATAVASPPPVANPYMRGWYGVVYDLVTLRPISQARLTFRANGNPVNWATTTMTGHYMVMLDRSLESGRITVEIADQPGYRNGVLEDKDPPLRERKRSDRKHVMEEISENDLEPIPLRFMPSSDVIELDLVLVPTVKK